MRWSIFMLLCLFRAAVATAQTEVVTTPIEGDGEPFAPAVAAASAVSADTSLAVRPPVVPLLSISPDQRVTFATPGGWWDVHDGFNANISAGVMCGFGHNNPYRGAAFFTSVEGLYAVPVTDRLTVAGGLGYTRYTGWGQSQGTLDIFGMANYRFNERLDATLFASHSFGPMGSRAGRYSPYIPTISSACTTVGAEFGVRVNNIMRLSVGLSVTREEAPNGWMQR